MLILILVIIFQIRSSNSQITCWKNRGYLTDESFSISLTECDLLHAPLLAFLYFIFFVQFFHPLLLP